jgi:hypothetical protein
LKTTPEFKDFFLGKNIDCIHVDDASDEWPSVLEVQFICTEFHFTEAKICTCVTARNSGGSFLNRVELVNGCIARAHSNVFIPSTLNGSIFSSDGLDQGKLKEKGIKLHKGLCNGTTSCCSEEKFFYSIIYHMRPLNFDI